MPSIRAAWGEAQQTLRRFPLVLLSAAIATASGWGAIAAHSHDTAWAASWAASTLGIGLFTAIAVTSERLGSRAGAFVLSGLATAALIAFAFAWHGWTSAIQIRRYVQLGVAFHLMVAFLPFLGRREPNGFWQFNRILFLRFCLSAVYSAVLFLGWVLAIVAVQQLFKVKIAETVYARLWITIAFLFNTWFFLGGVPRDLRALDERTDYPSGLKVFTQFVLLPLVVTYLAILTTYLGRILITGQWPSGWIGWLVSSVAAVGILSLLLVHPIREREENRWVSGYGRWFYVALLPSIGMLLVAIGKRITQYGVTEDRYFIAVLSVWLAGIAVLYIARRNAGIHLIPITLCAIAFLTAFGPFGAYTTSRRSQTSRLRALLAKAHVDPSGPRVAHPEVTHADRRELSASLDYLLSTHGARSLRGVLAESKWTGVDVTPSNGRASYDRDQEGVREVMDRLGLVYVNRWEQESSSWVSFYSQRTEPDVMPLAGYDVHVRLRNKFPQKFTIDDTPWEIGLSRRGQALRVVRGREIVLEFPTDTLVRLAHEHPTYGPNAVASPRFEAASALARGTLVLSSFTASLDRDSLSMTMFEGDLYLATTRAPR